jgi:uncharacterized protein (DUF4415 family)
MTASAKSTKHARTPGTLEGILPGESLDDFEKRVGDDIPELTEEDFKRARPIDDFPDLKAALERARGQRGPQKTPVKERVGLRLDHDVVEYFRSTGPGWQSRLNDILAAHVKRKSS